MKQTSPPISDTAQNASAGHASDAALAFWLEHLEGAARDLLGEPVNWSRACAPKPVPDDAAKLVLRGDAGPRAVLVGSADAAPDMAARHARRSLAAAEALSDELASVVLQPLAQGEVAGRSYVVWPFRQPGGEGRIARWRWRRRMAGPVSDWLLAVNEATRRPIASEALAERVIAPLSALETVVGASPRLLRAAEAAHTAFTDGSVSAVHVLMHNDCWTGNVLSPGKDSAGGRYPFTMIDWAGAEVAGYPGYDLARWSQSVRMTPTAYGKELVRHAGVLGCDPGAMPAHLAVALGHLAMHLEGFAPQRFVRMADECLEREAAALAGAGVRSTV